jgi:hypothetical protein
MENHIKLNPPVNNYLSHFRRAWINLEKVSLDEARRRGRLRRGKVPRKQP